MPFVRRQRKYYKYKDWSQPVLADSGVMGGDSFAVAQSSSYNSQDFWHLFASTPSQWHANSGNPSWVSWYNPNPLKVSKLYFAEHPSGQIASGIIQACDDNSSWVDILSFSNSSKTDAFEVDLSSNDKGYKYWRIYITAVYYQSGSNWYALINKGFMITAQESVEVLDKNNYDYHVDNNKLYNLVKRHRKYYKYDERVFEQPVLTANGTLGGDSFAVASNVVQYSGHDVFKLFNNDTAYGFHSLQGTVTGYIDLYDPNPLKITNILVNNQNAGGSANRASTAGTIYGSNNGSDWELITSYTNTVQGINAQWNIDLSSNNKYYKYYRLESTACGTGGYWTIGEITLTAQEKVAVEINVGGEDVWENWKQPILSSNDVMGGSKFAVAAESSWSGYEIYYSVDGNSSTYWLAAQNTRPSFYFYNPRPLIVSKIEVTRQWSGSGIYATYGEVYGSNDYNTWSNIGSFSGGTYDKGFVCDLSSNNKAYKYYKITPTNTTTAGWGIAELKITAQELIKVGGSVEDADYYIDSNKPYNLVKRHRNYYKYGERLFEQPVLTSNGTLGGNSFAVSSNVTQYNSSDCAVYMAFDNTANTQFHSTAGVKTGYIDLYNPNPLNITNIKITNQGAGNRASTAGTIYGSSDSEKWEQITTYTNTVQSSNGVWNIDLSSNTKYYNYYRLESTAGGSDSYWTIGEITLTAQEKGLYVKINVGGGDVFRDWKQPVLSSNGVMGGSKFAVNQSSVLSSVNSDGAWLVFDGVGSTTRWHSAQSLPAWLSWYNPNPLKITNVKVTNRSTDGSYPNAYQLQYSDDNLSWTTAVSGNGTSGDSVSWNILVAHDTAHKYWRLYITSASGGYSTYVAIGEIEITAQELKAVGGSVEDADGYIDTNKRY